MTRCLHGTCDMPVRQVVHRVEKDWRLLEERCLNGHSFWPEKNAGTMTDPPEAPAITSRPRPGGRTA